MNYLARDIKVNTKTFQSKLAGNVTLREIQTDFSICTSSDLTKITLRNHVSRQIKCNNFSSQKFEPRTHAVEIICSSGTFLFVVEVFLL